MFVTSWERYTGVDISPLAISHQLSVNVTQLKAIADFSLAIKSRLVVAFPRLVRN